MNRTGFDQDKYLRTQSEMIKERIAEFGGKLYLEFGGKLFDDFHASRVLPGFLPDSKINMLRQLKDQSEIVIAINSDDIEKNKIRGDLGITYDLDVLRLIDAFRGNGFLVNSVVLTRYQGQPAAEAFIARLAALGIKSYKHYPIPGYPYDVNRIVSDEGYGKNEYIETTRPLVVVSAPGPGSGKMAICLSQLYHDNKKGIKSGYAKYETFPIWNLPLGHPVNLAYEAATADLNDINMIDPFHLEAYGKSTVNYNRDVEIFPVLKTMFQLIYGSSPYKSPTDMGVNMAGSCIIDDFAVSEASKEEIIRRYFDALCGERQGLGTHETTVKIELIMNRAGISVSDRAVVAAALNKETETGAPAMALQLNDSTIVTGKTSSLLGPASAMLLNALKSIAGISKSTLLMSPEVIGPIQELKVNHLGNHNPRLHTDEVLIALSICAAQDPIAKKAMDCLKDLNNTEAHSTVMLSQVDVNTLKKLGIRLTCEPKHQTKKLFHK